MSGAIEEAAPVTREAPFYSDPKDSQLPIKNLHVGDTLEWKVREVRTVPEARDNFWGRETFLDHGIMAGRRRRVTRPLCHVRHGLVESEKQCGTVSTIEGSERVYLWTHSNLKPTVGKDAELAAKTEETHMLSPEEQIDLDQGKVATERTLCRLHPRGHTGQGPPRR